METFPRYWPFMRGIHRSVVDSSHTGQWRGALIFSLIYAWTNGWANNRNAGDLRRHRAHYDAIVMWQLPRHSVKCLSRRITITYNSWLRYFTIVHSPQIIYARESLPVFHGFEWTGSNAPSQLRQAFLQIYTNNRRVYNICQRIVANHMNQVVRVKGHHFVTFVYLSIRIISPY